MIKIALIETERGTIRGYGGWVEVEGNRYRIDWELAPGDPLPAGVTFPALLAAARAGREILVADDDSWVLEGP